MLFNHKWRFQAMNVLKPWWCQTKWKQFSLKLVLNKTGTTSVSAEKSFIKAGLSSSKKNFC